MPKAELLITSPNDTELERSDRVDAILLELGEMRQAKVTAETLLIYGRELESFEINDIAKGCRKLGMMEVDEFQRFRMPTCGIVVSSVRQAERSRKERIRPEMLRPEAREAWLKDGRRLGSGEETVDVRPLIADAARSGLSMGVVEKTSTPTK